MRPETATETRATSVSSTASDDRRPFEVWVERSFMALLLLLSALLLTQLIDFGAGRDQALYAVVSDTLLRGEAPYRDAWDFKPPGIYLLYAFARGVLGPGAHAIRVLEALALLSLFPAYTVLSRRHVGSARAGIVGVTLALLVYVPLEFWYTAQPEGFGAVVLAWALVFATWSPSPDAAFAGERRQFAAWVTAAALYSVAALLKPPLGGGILVSFAIVVAMRRSERRDAGWLTAMGRPTAAFALGGVLPLVVTFAGFEAIGAGAELRDALLVFAPGYTAIDFGTSPPLALIGRALFEFVVLSAPYHLIGIVALFALPVLGERERIGSAHVLGVAAFTLLGVALQAKFFPYHYAAALPLSGLLAGWGLWKIWVRARRTPWGVAVLAAGIAAAQLVPLPEIPNLMPFWHRTGERFRAWNGSIDAVASRDRLYSHGDVNAESNRLAAAWILANTPTDSRLFVWGFEPILYLASERRPASRYVHNVPQRAKWTRTASRETLLRELTQTPPETVVLVTDDALPWVTGNPRDSRQALETYPELRSWIEANYRPVERFGDLTILLRIRR
jgi:hypothetical protein